jgi:hypothetical protein
LFNGLTWQTVCTHHTLAVAQGLAGGAHALAIVAVLARLVAAPATCTAVVLV